MESLEMRKTMFSCLASTSKKLISRPRTDLRNLARIRPACLSILYPTRYPRTKLMEFRSLEGQEMYTGDKIVPLKDLNNFDSDPEEFARTLCKDLDIRDAEVALAVAVAIREQL
ncbi:hypothetical protein Syun_012870 [Stephania yunnanensis]|uniref:Uncharacterized protein n=1 Tax=Stephania yunnanensis TaxID=152371 RepID=A0AAP0PJB9_9MAGN